MQVKILLEDILYNVNMAKTQGVMSWERWFWWTQIEAREVYT